jgi:hypothetical protein
MLKMVVAVGLAGAGVGCSSSSEQPVPAVDGSTSTDGGTDATGSNTACTAPLVQLRTGQNTACSGGNRHAFPVGMGPGYCHGWRAIDTTGREHDNSANDIKCNPDGSFSFVQFAGSLDCTGNGVLKSYVSNSCTRDIPPSLYTVAFDLSCCSAPDSPACQRGVPSVTVPGAGIFVNGTRCSAP